VLIRLVATAGAGLWQILHDLVAEPLGQTDKVKGVLAGHLHMASGVGDVVEAD
jgi:hypothetical protein